MPKPDRKPDPDFEPNYDIADAEYDEAPLADYDVGADAEYEADPEYDDSVQFGDESEVADPDYAEAVIDVVLIVKPEPVVYAPPMAEFAFELGRAVLPLGQHDPHAVLWRGHLKEPHPVTGLLHRVPVYQLTDGYWDCYREEELQVA